GSLPELARRSPWPPADMRPKQLWKLRTSPVGARYRCRRNKPDPLDRRRIYGSRRRPFSYSAKIAITIESRPEPEARADTQRPQGNCHYRPPEDRTRRSWSHAMTSVTA